MTNRTLCSALLLLTAFNLHAQVADAGPSPYVCGTNHIMFAMFQNRPLQAFGAYYRAAATCGPDDPFTPVVGLCVGETSGNGPSQP